MPNSPTDPLDRCPASLAAVVALARRRGADTYPFEATAFYTAAFQREFLAAAERLAVTGAVLVELDRAGALPALAGASGLDAARHLKLARRQAMAWDLERDAVLARLARAGVPALLLKGAALRLTAYTDSAEREFADIDVLVPAETVDRAVAALEAAGYDSGLPSDRALYRAHHHHLILKKAPGFIVEVHWGLDSGDSAFTLDADGFRGASREVVTPRGSPAAVPRPEHMVLHLAHQNLETGFSHLRRLVDVDRTIASAADFDWNFLAAESKRMRAHIVLALTLRLAEQLLHTALPAGFIVGLDIPAAARFHLALLDPVRLLLEQHGNRRAIEELLLLWCLADPRGQLRELKAMATGERSRWRAGLSEPYPPNGPGVRLAAMAKLVGYQTVLYPLRAVRAHDFW